MALSRVLFLTKVHKSTEPEGSYPESRSKMRLPAHAMKGRERNSVYWSILLSPRCLQGRRRSLLSGSVDRMKRYLSAFLAAAVVSTAAYAQSSPDAVVKSAVEGTVAAMKADPQARGGDMAKITQLVQTRFVPATDFQRTTRIAVGKAWSHRDARAAKTAVRAVYAAARAHLRGVAVAVARPGREVQVCAGQRAGRRQRRRRAVARDQQWRRRRNRLPADQGARRAGRSTTST